MANLANFLMFQAGWFLTVIGAANGMPWLSLLALLVMVPLHCFCVGSSAIVDLKLMGLALFFGLLWETLVLSTGWIAWPSGVVVEALPPYWILSMWVQFAMILNRSLGWLQPYMWLSVLFGSVGGPLAYYAGFRLGALQLIEPVNAMLLIGAGWAVITPLLMYAARVMTRQWFVRNGNPLVIES